MIRTVTNPSPIERDAIELSRPRLVRQSAPGSYVVLEGPPVLPSPAWHRRQAELYRDGAAHATSSKDRETLSTLATMHEGRAG